MTWDARATVGSWFHRRKSLQELSYLCRWVRARPLPMGSAARTQNLSIDGPMTSDTIHIVQDSWNRVAPFSGAAAAIFFDRLLELDPSFRRVFPDGRRPADIAEFNRLVTVAVRSLGRLENVVPAAADLGRRAARLGLGDAHYRAVAEAFMWSLERVLGNELTPCGRKAWSEAFLTLAAAARRAGAAARALSLATALTTPVGPPPAVAIC
jgi:hemoglobin-like flavoprotein